MRSQKQGYPNGINGSFAKYIGLLFWSRTDVQMLPRDGKSAQVERSLSTATGKDYAARAHQKWQAPFKEAKNEIQQQFLKNLQG